MMKNINELKPGKYNVNKETIINGKTYDKLISLVSVKGNKPTAGEINIEQNGLVGTAILCVNNYVIDYSSSKAEIIADDCGNMNLIIDYNIDSAEWKSSKLLTITYPAGEYEHYIKLESGSVKLGDKSLIIGEEVKVDAQTATLTLTNNSKITAWLVKGTKKLAERSYNEEKIDSVQLGTIKSATAAGYPLATASGISLQTTLTLTYDEQEGTSAYYSLDNGSNWIKYTGKVSVDSTSIKAKLKRDVSGIETEPINVTISTATDALPAEAYDTDDNSCVDTYASTFKTSKLYVDPSAIGKRLYVLAIPSNFGGHIYFKNKDGEMVLDKAYSPVSYEKIVMYVEILEGTSYIEIAPAYAKIYTLKIVD